MLPVALVIACLSMIADVDLFYIVSKNQNQNTIVKEYSCNENKNIVENKVVGK